MPQFNIKTYNNIAVEGLKRFPKESYLFNEDPPVDAIILRSHSLHDHAFDQDLLAVARAGAGYNNVPVDQLSEQGVVVFNTPGANANSVKELVIGSMINYSRQMHAARLWVEALDAEGIEDKVEAGKKQFKGSELQGKTMGVIGLGSIGHLVANDTYEMGMKVIGYDPYISVEAAWKINQYVEQAETLEAVLQEADYLTIHVPMSDDTYHYLDAAALNIMKPSAVLMNFSRSELVDIDAVKKALDDEKIAHYITDFPNAVTREMVNCTAYPHLGASTDEAEINCAVMAANQLRRFLETGEIVNSVNYPRVEMRLTSPTRIAICNKNVQNMIAVISQILAEYGINIDRIINKSRDDYAYTLVDIPETNADTLDEIVNQINAVDGILKARLILQKNVARRYL